MDTQKFSQKIKKIYQQKYGVAVFDIEIKNTKKGIAITGEVLTENQKDDILNALKNEKINKVNLKILNDANKRNEIGWAVVKIEIADLKSRFVSNKIISNKILKRIRCSQVFKNEILRILFKKDDQLLVQSNDLSLGWINRKEVILKRRSLYKKWKCEKFKFAKNKNKIIKEAEKFLGVEYLLGGKSEKGIDCSGLTQVVYKNVFNMILPRHSWDQKKIGKKVNLKNIETGDLIFLIRKLNQHKHIGIIEIVEKNKTVNLVHASLENKKVVKQKLDKVFKKYDFKEVRRIVKNHKKILCQNIRF